MDARILIVSSRVDILYKVLLIGLTLWTFCLVLPAPPSNPGCDTSSREINYMHANECLRRWWQEYLKVKFYKTSTMFDQLFKLCFRTFYSNYHRTTTSPLESTLCSKTMLIACIDTVSYHPYFSPPLTLSLQAVLLSISLALSTVIF